METIIIGGGLSGLVCAQTLQAAGHECQIFEASDRVGGRIKTDNVDGFLLDHGFQVFLTAYPEARNLLDYHALKFGKFEPGALIQCDGLHRLVDPWRRPNHFFATAFSAAATFSDKLKVRQLRSDVTKGGLDTVCEWPEQSTMELLRDRGFSDVIIERFFRPFLGGIFLEQELETSSRKFAFVFRMFSEGEAGLPAGGMEEIPKQLAATLKEGTIRTGTTVELVERVAVSIAGSNEKIGADNIVIATEEPAAKRLMGDPPPENWQKVHCHYFAADEAPFNEAILMLNGSGRGTINNLCVPNLVCESYAPAGKSLISVTTLSDASREDIDGQLKSWFGSQVAKWSHLKTYTIDYALPSQNPPALSPVAKQPRLQDNIYLCGDYLDTASINGAMAAGRRAAEAILS